MITIDKIQTYLNIQKEVGILVQMYYEEFIKCDDSYTLNRWFITPQNEITIVYSFYDYHDEHCCDDTTVTLEDLNGVKLENVYEPTKCSCGGVFDTNGTILI